MAGPTDSAGAMGPIRAGEGEGAAGGEPAAALPRRAVALRYDRSPPAPDAAPRVVAKGRGALAERILELAREHGLPVREDPDLVQLLSACELGDEIPVEVYQAVAELLTWLYGIQAAGGERPGA